MNRLDGLIGTLVEEFASVDASAELLRMVLMHAVVQTESDRGVISWIDGNEMVVGHCYDPFGATVPVGSRWPLIGDEVTRVGLALGRIAAGAEIPDNANALSPALRDTYAGLRHLLVVPVTVAGEDIALICVSRRRAEVFAPEQRTVLEIVARTAAQPLQAARLHDQLVTALANAAEHSQRSATLERVQTDILRLASHELRTPLTVLNGYLSLINDGFFGQIPDPLAGVMAILQRRTADINSLVNDMLVAARVEDGEAGRAGAPTDLCQLLRDAVATVAPRASPAHTMRIEVPPDPVIACVDAERMTVALRNIIDNAVKYSPQGGEVAASLSVADGRVMIRVADHGLGIRPGDRAKLFTRFGRILTTDNSHIPGIGLGLYFTREVARRYGGDVALLADSDEGTVFELTLPLSS